MANAAGGRTAADDAYLQELIRGSMPGPSSSRPRVAPLTDDEIGWFRCGICVERRLVFDRFRAGCAHEFCIECVVHYIEGRVADGAGCRECAMHPEACKKLLDIDFFSERLQMHCATRGGCSRCLDSGESRT